MMPEISWAACDAATGVVILDIANVSMGEFSDTIMGYASTTATLPTRELPPGWSRIVRPRATTWVQLVNDVPVAGGMVVKKDTSSPDAVDVVLTTIPDYFRGRYVGDEAFTGVDQCEIAATLVESYAADSLALDVVFEPSARTRDRTYVNAEDKSLYSALTELAGVDNGPEWAVYWSATTVGSQQAYVPVFYAADRLGTHPTNGLKPAVTFERGTSITAFAHTEDYTVGKGANSITAVSTAFEDVRPESDPAIATTDRVTFEYRFTPSTSISIKETLDEHAAGALARMADGTESLTLTLVDVEGATAGIDYGLGDTVGIAIDGSAFEQPLIGTARVVGWQRTYGSQPKVIPTLTDITLD
jgi:hypothetical protein